MNPVEPLIIYGVAACPYAQRTQILLHMKQLPFESHEINLTKPRDPGFLKLNPAGKVPVLIHRGRALNESSVINEYLEEVFPANPAFPADPYWKAQARILVDYCNSRFTTNHYRVLMEQDPARRVKAEATFVKDWEWLENFLQRMESREGYAFGEFGMADLTYAPFFERAVLNEYFWGFRLPAHLTRVASWRAAVAAHPSVRATSLSAEHYIKLYEDYSLGYSNGAIPAGRTHSSFDLSIPLDQRPMPSRRMAME
jgi:glutathione S-transferase